jgi:hypothetical protein
MAKIVNETELIFDKNDIINKKRSLDTSVFRNNNVKGKDITKIVLPNGITRIDYYAFSGYKSLQEINIPDSVTEIGFYAFYKCESLQKINIPDGVTYIGEGAFQYCKSLREIHIPDSVAYIGERALEDCTSIYYKEQDITHLIYSYGSEEFDVIKSLYDNDLPLTDDMFMNAFEAKKEDRLRGFLVKTKKRFSEREIPDIDYSNFDDFNKEF